MYLAKVCFSFVLLTGWYSFEKKIWVRKFSFVQSVGRYPNCSCKEPMVYDSEKNYCFECPTNSQGLYPDCHCESGIFGKANLECIECPADSKGKFSPKRDAIK